MATATRPTNARRAARLKAGLTAKQVARKLRICEAYYRQIERQGRTNPHLAADIARILNCPMELFVYLR